MCLALNLQRSQHTKRKHNDKTIDYTPSATSTKASYTWFACNSFNVNNTQKTSLKSIPILFMCPNETPKRPIL